MLFKEKNFCLDKNIDITEHVRLFKNCAFFHFKETQNWLQYKGYRFLLLQYINLRCLVQQTN